MSSKPNRHWPVAEWAHQRLKFIVEFLFRRRQLPCKVKLLDPKKADTIGSILDHELDIVMRGKIRLDRDRLSVTRSRRLAALALATKLTRAVGIEPLLERELCLLGRRNDHDGPKRIHQQLVTAPNLTQQAREFGDRRYAFFAREQCRVRALPQRFDKNCRNISPRQ